MPDIAIVPWLPLILGITDFNVVLIAAFKGHGSVRTGWLALVIVSDVSAA